MTAFLLRPLSPLIFRRGVEFGDDAGADGSEVHAMPLPATVAGAVRAAWADGADWCFGGPEDHAALRECITVSGPLLVRTAVDGDPGISGVMVPMPADAVALQREASDGSRDIQYRAMRPWRSDTGSGTDLPHGLCPVDGFGLERYGDMVDAPPQLWALDNVIRWLLNPEPSERGDQGAPMPPLQMRPHVALDEDKVGINERFYSSTEIDFGAMSHGYGNPFGWVSWRYDLLVDVAVEGRCASTGNVEALQGRARTLGAEGRACHITSAPSELWAAGSASFEPDTKILEKHRMLRVMLVTPALLRGGWIPDWLSADASDGRLRGCLPYVNVRVELVAVRSETWVPWAGRDSSAKNDRKTRSSGGGSRPIARLVPAGSVYWLRLLDQQLPEAGALARCFLKPIESGGQAARDGHGLMLVGIGSMSEKGP
jgi:hypothetical protein